MKMELNKLWVFVNKFKSMLCNKYNCTSTRWMVKVSLQGNFSWSTWIYMCLIVHYHTHRHCMYMNLTSLSYWSWKVTFAKSLVKFRDYELRLWFLSIWLCLLVVWFVHTAFLMYIFSLRISGCFVRGLPTVML